VFENRSRCTLPPGDTNRISAKANKQRRKTCRPLDPIFNCRIGFSLSSAAIGARSRYLLAVVAAGSATIAAGFEKTRQ
jgi:hypothetical protein